MPTPIPTRRAKNAGAGCQAPSAEADESHKKPATVEYVNIGLMLVALLVASVVPFELFLFSYAVLGPLHYVTEISWLHDRRFFTLRRIDWLPLVICTVLITLGNTSVLGDTGAEWLNTVRPGGIGLADMFRSVYADVTFFAFGAALVFVLTGNLRLRVLGIVLVGICSALFHLGSAGNAAGLFIKLFGVYLPTLVHVFVFTGAFILVGALKRRSIAGYASLAVFIACGLLAIWLPNYAAASQTGAPAVFWRGFRDLSFASLNDLMGRSVDQLIGTNVFTSELVLRLVRFLAFAYTYHYLNWFSKTSIIQWHAVSKARLAVVGTAWIASVGLYLVNYDLGLRWLFLLSLGHVLLEFPLNHKSFIEIGAEIGKRFGFATSGS